MPRFLRCFTHRFKRSNNGAVAVEFALVIPILLVLLFGIIEFGRIIWMQSTMQFAVESTTRYAMTHSNADEDQLVEYVENQLWGMSADNITILAVFDDVDGQNYLTISATSTFDSILSFLPIDQMDIAAKSRIPVAN